MQCKICSAKGIGDCSNILLASILIFFFTFVGVALCLFQEPQPNCQALVAEMDRNVQDGRAKVAEMELSMIRARLQVAEAEKIHAKMERLLSATGPLWRSDSRYLESKRGTNRVKHLAKGIELDLEIARGALHAMVRARDETAQACLEGKELAEPSASKQGI